MKSLAEFALIILVLVTVAFLEQEACDRPVNRPVWCIR